MNSDNPFYQPPAGFCRKGNGWLQVAKTPQQVVSRRLKKENIELKKRLEKIEEFMMVLSGEEKS